MKALLLAACLLCPPAFAQAATDAAADPQAAAKREIGVVIEAFRTAIIDKDKPKFLALFPEAGKANYNPKYSHLGFIDGIVSEPERNEEVFDDIRIDTDGEIASVAFDYRFLQDGRETNRGREAWNLVRTDAGWKIVSVVWSMHWPIEPAS
jgi:hypothetical protein